MILRPANVDPYTFWNDYCKKNPITALELLPNLEGLRRQKKFRDIEAALRGFLAYRAKDPEPWLYEMLAEAIAVNKGRDSDVQTALTYAAQQALRTGRSLDLTRVADNLAIHGRNEEAGKLLDRAVEIDPGEPRVHLMAIKLASRLNDPRRMAAAVERFLSLGWPGVDELWRIEVRRQVEAMSRSLKEANKNQDAASLLEQLKASESRDLVLILTWTGNAGLDLVVDEPLGATATILSPRTVFGGAIVKDGYGKHPEEVYVCPRAFDGDYKVHVESIYNDEKNPAQNVTLTVIRHEGGPNETKEVRKLDVNALANPIVVTVKGGRRTAVLPYQAPPVLRIPGPAPKEKDQAPAEPAQPKPATEKRTAPSTPR